VEDFNLASLLIGFIVGCVASCLSYFIFIKFIKLKSNSDKAKKALHILEDTKEIPGDVKELVSSKQTKK